MNFISNLKHPTAYVAKEIENLVIKGKNSPKTAEKIGYGLLSRLMSVTVFPSVLTAELFLKHVPKFVLSIPVRQENKEKYNEKCRKNFDKVTKYALGLTFSPLGIRAGDGVSGLFLKAPNSNEMIRPFGVEEQYGKKVEQIYCPTSVEELQDLVKKAKQEKRQISIVGAGLSQGPHTVPANDHYLVINTKHLNQIEVGSNSVKVQAGATWEEIQCEVNKKGKSVIVKQASDIFSIGGSIAINCHGWAHEYGAISSTVESLDVIDAHGELRTLTPKDELFGCFFGTLGYFGVIVNATFKLENNEQLVERTEEVDLSEFIQHYKNKIKGHDIPLFGGRLVLDNMDANPLRKVCMVSYEKEKNELGLPIPAANSEFKAELKYGKRLERIALQALGRLSYFTTRRLISWLWNREKELMLTTKHMTRNEALHPPINPFKMLHNSNLHTQWLQEYFITEEHLPNFLRFLGAELKANDVRLINATIRPTPKDSISILPYAEQDRYAVVICFGQLKTENEIERSKQWMMRVNEFLISQGDIYYQAYMPFTTQEQFEKCYGKEKIEDLRKLKQKYDPENLFSNSHTKKYFDLNPKSESV